MISDLNNYDLNKIFVPWNHVGLRYAKITDRMGEDIGVLEGSHTKSGVPIEHLDYRYIEQCKNGKELEKILKVLR
ncbi:hypothetical protein P5673_020844 [Acropora cervicornis]|uniref:Uncharacterized protein n=1 Tax=Acropora cervicornis TaxID=6130 RepID=A0AAD9V0T6_ACRCE|nr:hypothetical protein P5673_020844 [Acropora cervicornis]